MWLTRLVADEMLFWVSLAFGKQIHGQYKEQIQTTDRVQRKIGCKMQTGYKM